MRHVKILGLALIALAVLGGSAWGYKTNFLATAVDVNAGVTKVNGTNFTSIEINVEWSRWVPGYGALTLTFTRTAGSSSEVYFEFQVSVDNGTTWSTAYYIKINIPTNETAVSNVVRVTKEIQFWGITNIRLYRIVNNDPANNLTACNASLSF